MKFSFGTFMALAALTATTLAASDASSALAMAQASYPKCTVSTTNNPRSSHLIHLTAFTSLAVLQNLFLNLLVP